MKRFALALLLLGCSAAPAPTPPPAAPVAPAAQGAPGAIQAEGVPPIPKGLTDRLLQYQSARSASFEDFGPDGSILISTRFAETAQLHRVPFPGGRREQLTFTEEPVAGGVFVPGTQDILYSQGRGGDENWQIHRLDRKAGRSTLLTDGKSRYGMGPISRKGDRMVISSTRRNGKDTDLYLLDLKTGTTEILLETKAEFWVATDWSPDDSRLALLRIVSVNESHLAVMDLKSREKKGVVEPGGGKVAHGAPRFSRDGRLLAFASDARGEFKEIAIVDLETRKTEWSKQSWDVTDVEISGEQMAFVTNEDGASRLTIARDGPDLHPELPPGVISGLRFSPDGKRLGFTLSRADAPGDAYTYELDARKLVRWTYSETGGLDPASFVTPQRFSYKSFDGRDIPAYLYLPKGARKAPVVISIHGGPESQTRPSFSPVTQFWTGELGIAVIAPNVRGSTGYGKTYVALDNGEKREDSVKDIGALLDWIAKQPELDASRVAVQGGSYGGYMVLASLVHFGDRLKAGVDIVGIGNFNTFFEKTSAYRADLRRVEYGDERDPKMREFFERIAPANHADRIRSALLVAHGRKDPRVPFAEA
ncbi:MAG TPA: prolyl oligopeptidase family serine peptidase, partial [Planctomycetota bacterium]|nr:prolyl oligopeptidase family serine peptidase [Planctomycetota bacterium]